MTLNEIAYNLLNLIRGGRSNHDEHISLSQIKFNIKHYRAVFIRRDYAKNGFISRHIEQDLGCLKVIKVDASKCCNLPIDCSVYRTIKEIPRTIRYNFEDAISYVGDVTGMGTIPLVSPQTVPFLPYDKYTNKKMKSYVLDNYVYIYNAEGLEFVNVRGVFEDPQHVAAFECCDGDYPGSQSSSYTPTTNCDSCYSDDKHEFPIPMDMIQSINQGILGGQLKLL